MDQGRADDERGASSVTALLLETLRTLPLSVVLATLAINVTGLALPLVTISLYDRLIPQQATQTLAVLAVCVAAVIVFEAILKVARSQVIFWLATQNAWRSYSDGLERILAAPRDWIVKQGPSHLLDRLRAQQVLAEWLGSPSRLVLVDLPFVVLFIGLMAIIGGWMALVPTSVFLCMGVLFASRGAALQSAARARAQEDMRAQDFIVESLLGLPQIKGGAMEAQMSRRFERLQRVAAHWSYEATRIAEDARGNSDLLASLTQIATLGIGATAVCAQSMTAGTLAGCTMLAGRAVQPLLRFMSMWNEIQSLAVERDKSLPIRALPKAGRATGRRQAAGAIGFELLNVDVAAHAGIKPALSGANLNVAAGSIVSILGTHGPGSSPLSALLTGQSKPNGGIVRMGGLDAVRDEAAWKSSVIAVLPTHKALGGTILENLAMFRDGSGQAAAIDAARLINLEAEIMQLPHGYQTRIGDTSASEISESLMQMIAVARAVALKPGVLILDEASAALDQEHSQLLEHALPEIAQSMTVVLLTNRPSFAALADQRYVIEDGTFAFAQDQAREERLHASSMAGA